jgi:predicted phage terminase large subunit-like protein
MGSNHEKLALLKEARFRKCRADFLAYRKTINPKIKWGWWQEEIAVKLQEFYDDLIAGKRPKLVIQAPPQHGKSVQIIDFISWVAGKHPELRTIYTSFSERLGIRANLRLQRLYDSVVYQEIFPRTRINKSGPMGPSGQYLRNREILEYVDSEGFFRNTTVRGSITGESLDLGVIDDPIRGRSDANSETIRDAAWDWFTDDFFTRFSEEAGLLAILTRWHIDDPIGRLIERYPDVKVLSYAAIAEVDEPHRKKGEALFPEHKSIEFLREREKIMDSGNWLALYQQRPTAAEGELFKPDQIQVIDALPYGHIQWVRGWDLASTTDGDFTAGGKLGRLPDGRFVIGDMVRLRVGPDERDAAMVNTASQDGVSTKISIPQDPGQAGKTQVLYLTRELVGYPVTTSPESGDKVTRAEPFAAQVNVGNVVMLRGSWNNALIDEMRMFPNGSFDDQIDSLSRAFSHLIGGGLAQWAALAG